MYVYTASVSDSANTDWKLELLESILTPLVRIMLRARITYAAFAETAQRIYAREAMNRLEKQIVDRRPNLSEITIESGLPLSQLKILLASDQDESRATKFYINSESAVLEMWQFDARFVEPTSGKPLDLPLTSDSGNASFRELVRKATRANVGFRAMLTRLISANNVEMASDRQTVRFLKPIFMSEFVPGHSAKFPTVAAAAVHFLSTLDRNEGSPGDGLFERRVFSRRPTPSSTTKLREILTEQCDEVRARAIEWEDLEDGEEGKLVGAGYYVFEVPDDGVFVSPTDNEDYDD